MSKLHRTQNRLGSPSLGSLTPLLPMRTPSITLMKRVLITRRVRQEVITRYSSTVPDMCSTALLFDVSEGLETPVQLTYLLTLLGFLAVGAFLVVRQVLIRRELEEAAKVLGDRVRSGEATAEDHFELGVILLRKKLYTQATKSLEKARKEWEGEPEELAQVYNALGYAFFNMDRPDAAVIEYRKAVELQPGYVTAWNNLGDALESQKNYQDAYNAYKEALSYAPDNKVAQARFDFCKTRLERQGVM